VFGSIERLKRKWFFSLKNLEIFNDIGRFLPLIEGIRASAFEISQSQQGTSELKLKYRYT
jgi:hypothetical protein